MAGPVVIRRCSLVSSGLVIRTVQPPRETDPQEPPKIAQVVTIAR